MENFADRLLSAIDDKGAPACVGLDPVYDRLPQALRRDASRPGQLQAIEEFCLGVLEAVAPHVPAIKPQSAYFEIYRSAGVELYFRLVARARQLGLLVIGDVKRNDIGTTAEAYAKGHLAGPDAPDAVTVNGYLGSDGIEPFLQIAAGQGKGVFVLVRTSNPSATEVQDFTDAAGRKLYEHLAGWLAELGDAEGLTGRRGYSGLGAVVGATWPQEAAALRRLMPRQIFLVPGYGAQGGTAADCKTAFNADGTGAIVNASRSVLYPWGKSAAPDDWQPAVADAARAFALDLRTALQPK